MSTPRGAAAAALSRSQNGFMPQPLLRGVVFSGLCVQGTRVPFIFLTSGDPAATPSPRAGRSSLGPSEIPLLRASL